MVGVSVLLVLATIFGMTSTATSSSAQTTTTGNARLGTVVAPASRPKSSVRFAKCDALVECATVSVPLSPANPRSARISLHVTRRVASQAKKRVGTLFMNPGGPGSPASDIVRNASLFLTPEVLARYDLIGVDPRGTERSTPFRCGSTTGKLPGPGSSSGSGGGSSQATQVRAVYADIAKSCQAVGADILEHLDTPTNAADLDAVREALGERRISFLGLSYGTYLGAVYETRYPQRVARVVLDSAMTPTRFGTGLLVDRAVAHENALDAFLEACTNGEIQPCPFNDGSDLWAKYAQLRANVADASPFGSRGFDTQVSGLVGLPKSGWPVLSRALQELTTTGKANFNEVSGDNITRDDRDGYVPQDTFSELTNLAVNCRDGILPRSADAYSEVLTQISGSAPRFSGLAQSSALAALTCVGWPAATIPTERFRSPGVPTLVIANRFDLTTPMEWSQSLASQLGGRLLVREGGGHVAGDKSACVKLAVAEFLINASPPAATNTTCSG